MKIILFIVFLTINLFAIGRIVSSDDLDKLENIKLQLQWKHQFEFAGFYAAKEKGFYKDVGLDVEFKELEHNAKVVDEVLAGNAEYGVTYSSLLVDYMQGKPVVMIANFLKQSPFVLVTQKGINTPGDLKGKKVMGLSDSIHQDTIKMMLKRFNIDESNIQSIAKKFSMQEFIQKKVDAITAFSTNEIYELEKKHIAYNLFDPATYGISFYDVNLFTTQHEAASNPQRVEKFRDASIKGWKYALENRDEIIELILKKYNSQNKSKEALLFEARQIEYKMLTYVYPIGSIDLQRLQIIKESYVQSGYISKENTKNLEPFIYHDLPKRMILTSAQQKYLQQKKELNVCVDPNWMPLEKIDSNGKHVGIAADFMELISQKIDIPIRLVETKSWTQSLENAQKRACDILALTEKTPMRERYLDFTTPYIITPIVIVTKQGIPFINDINSIKDKPLGIVKNYSIKELLQYKYPDINLVEVKSIQDGLEQVQKNKIFGFLDNAIVLNYQIQMNHMNDIGISGSFKESFALSIGSRNDEKLLNEILENALKSVNESTRNKITNRWINTNYKIETDYKMVFIILSFAIIILSFFMYWNLKLRENAFAIKQKTMQLKIAKQQLEEMNDSLEEKIKQEIDKNAKQQLLLMQQNRLAQIGEMIENIAHQWRQPLAQINSSVLLIDLALNQNDIHNERIEDKLSEIESLTLYMSKTIDDFRNFFNPKKQKKVFNLYDALNQALLIVKGSLESNYIDIKMDIDKSFMCESYMQEFQQVIVIILNNAKDALVSNNIQTPQVKIEAQLQDENYEISICDNGIGIKDKLKEKVFEPYFTTKHQSLGTGLGLYIAKTITEEGFKGKLSVENNYPRGACFKIRFPKGDLSDKEE